MPAASITFRMRSSNYVGTIDMQGDVIACREVQEAVAAKLQAPVEELRIFLAGSAAPLHPGEDLPAYAVVDVVRQVNTGRPPPRQRPSAMTTTAYNNSNNSSHRSTTLPSSTSAALTSSSSAAVSLAGDNRVLTEEERLAQLQAEVGAETGIDEVGGRFRRGGGGGGRGGGGGYDGRRGRGGSAYGRSMPFTDEMFRPPPPGYICHNCGKSGHLIQHCPAARTGKGLKLLSLPLGIPETMLVECTMDDPAPKFITRDHRLVKRRIDASAFDAVHALAPPQQQQEQQQQQQERKQTQQQPQTTTTARAATTAADAAADSTRNDGDAGDGDTDKDATRLCCVVDGVLAVHAMRLPCCGRLMCESCFSAMAEDALAGDAMLDEASLPRCPACDELLILDAVTDAHAERQAIDKLRQQTQQHTSSPSARKRSRE